MLPRHKNIVLNNEYKKTLTISPPGGDGHYVCDGTGDQEIVNLAFNENPGQRFIILNGDYSINNPILPLDNQEIIIEGTITQNIAVTSLLTENASSGQATVTVTDASLFFKGQYVSVLDPSQVVYIESAAKNFAWGEAGKITDITGNVITLEGNLSRNYTVAGGAYLTTCHSSFLLENVYDVNIRGNGGAINNNKASQIEFEPLNLGGAGENVTVACGVSIKNSEKISISGLSISNAMLHNIFNYLSKNITIDHNTCTTPYFKNIGNWNCSNVSILDNTCTNSSYEDGIILYAGNSYFNISNNSCSGNKRSAFFINTINSHITFNKNYAANTGTNYGVYLLGSNITARNNTYYSPASHGCLKISGTDITIDDETYTGSLAGTKNGYGILFINTSTAYPTNVVINNPVLTNCKVGIVASAGTVNCEVHNPTYSGCTANLTDNSGGGLTIT